MRTRRKPSTEGATTARARSASSPARAVPSQEEAVQAFFWNIISIENYFEKINCVQAQLLGVSVHQWMIMTAVKHLDRGGGISVKGVSTKLHADASFVTLQSKSLEKLGFLRRIASSEDARVVLMSLTENARKEMANLQKMHHPLNTSIFSELDEKALRSINEKLPMLCDRFQRIAKRMAAEL
jgi:DNA-binding MarR family transcriptional regulator